MAARVLHSKETTESKSSWISNMCIKYSTCALPDPKCVRDARVCMQMPSLVVYFVFRTLHISNTCTSKLHKSYAKFSIIIRCIAFVLPDTRCCRCVVHDATATNTRMKYPLNSQWFMVVSCKFDRALSGCVLKGGTKCIKIEWLFQFERNHLLQVNFSFRDLQSA